MEKKLEYTFSLYDIDGNGYLSKYEIIHAIDITLQFQENKQNSYDIEAVSKMFQGLDTSKDGKISKRNSFYIDLFLD